MRTFLEYKLDISDTPIPFSYNTKECFYAEHPEGALCPHKGCRARLLCYTVKERPYLKTWPMEVHVSGCTYAKKITKKQWHTDERIVESLEYQIKKRFTEMGIPPVVKPGYVPVPGEELTGPKYHNTHDDTRITFVYSKLMCSSKVGVHIVGGIINEPIIKNEGTDQEYALIDYKNGGRIFISMKMCKNHQIRDLIKLIEYNFLSKDALCDIACVCYGEIRYSKSYGYEIIPKNEKSIKWDLVILDVDMKTLL